VNIRRLALDVDKALDRPSLLEIGRAIDGCQGVEACNITVEEIDIETVGMDVIIEGANLDYEEIVAAIEKTGAAVHSLDELVFGKRVVAHVPRAR
jgi:hypothetical protein